MPVRHSRLAAALLALLAVAGLATRAGAQGIDGVSVTRNAGNTADELVVGPSPAFETRSTTQVVVQTATQLRTRYAAIASADCGAAGGVCQTGDGRTTTLASDYSVAFTVTTPGAYALAITTRLLGDLNVRDDGSGSGASDVSAVTGTYTGPGILSGTLGIADPGALASCAGGCNQSFGPSASAGIFGVSDGAPQSHILRFTWTQQATSTFGGTGGDEAAVRLGLAGQDPGSTADDYPGTPFRTAVNDGHFVTVSLTSLCGNGVIDTGPGYAEQCDLGAQNGAAGVCCTSACRFATAGSVCRAAASPCDAAETCSGSGTTCPADVLAPSGTVCRAAVGACDVAETCSGSSNTCPPDAIASAGATCRAAAGTCDVAETCDGVGTSCPADVLVDAGTACRAAAGDCDVAEACTGTSGACPADAFVDAGTTCRAAAGDCDVAETCTGAAAACPVDARIAAGTTCRAAAGDCDVAETCDGVGATCPADVLAGAGTTCRGAAGDCDVAETCSGTSAACPADVRVGAGVTCRAAAGTCDVAEACDGVAAACPVDVLVGAGVQCRPPSGSCDLPETCSGTDPLCPADVGGGPGVDTDADGVCDGDDLCPLIADPAQLDDDVDGLGNACDSCTLRTGVFTATKVGFTRLLAPPGNDRTKVTALLAGIPGSIDPAARGLRIIVRSASGATPIDATLPPGMLGGAGWAVSGSGNAWTYRNTGKVVPAVNGIVRVTVKASSQPGSWKIGIVGRDGSYPILLSDLPLGLTIALAPPYDAAGQCAERTWTMADCKATSTGDALKCR